MAIGTYPMKWCIILKNRMPSKVSPVPDIPLHETDELPFSVCLPFQLIVILAHLNDILRLSITDVDFKILLSLCLASPNASSMLRDEYAEIDAVDNLLTLRTSWALWSDETKSRMYILSL